MGLIRQKDRIKEVFLSVEGLVHTGEVNFDNVEALLHQFNIQKNMIVFVGGLTFLPAIDCAGAGETTLEIENDITFLQKVKSNHSFSRNGCLCISGDVECQIIVHVTDVGLPLLGQFL